MARPVLVLDPGHGGSAAVGGSSADRVVAPNRLHERDLTLDLARRLKALLAGDFDVHMTREADINLSLADRAGVARRLNADTFLSLHFNGDHDPGVNGTQAWIAKAGRNDGERLGRALIDHVAHVAQIRNCGVRRRDLGVLKTERHAANTAACLLEVSYLTNPREADQLAQESYRRALAEAIATGVRGFHSGASVMAPAIQPAPRRLGVAQVAATIYEEEGGEREILDTTKAHQDPENQLVNLPEPGSGKDSMQAAVPEGLRFSYWDLEVLDATPAAECKVETSPARGATGKVEFRVRWSHPPYGKVRYRLRAFASKDGSPAPARIVYGKPRLEQRTLSLIKQNVPLALTVRGEKAKQLYDAIKTVQKRDGKGAAESKAVYGEATEAITIITVTLVLGVLFAACVLVGMFVLYSIVMEAMKRGYDVRDTKFKSGFGEGATRTDHELVFNLSKQRPAAAKAAASAAAAGLSDWEHLVSLRPTLTLQRSIRKRVSGIPTWAGWPIQTIEKKATGEVNLDYYPVLVRRMPTVSGSTLTSEELLERLRLDINAFIDTRFGSFEPYDTDEAKRWRSASPEGTIVHIDMRVGSAAMNPDDGSVACTERSTRHFVFSTVWTPADLWHPVSGNREFGFTRGEDGTHTFYTRGADRTAGLMDRAMSGTVFSQAHALWMSLQQGIASFVNSNGGDAVIQTATSNRHDWATVMSAYHHPTRTWLPII